MIIALEKRRICYFKSCKGDFQHGSQSSLRVLFLDCMADPKEKPDTPEDLDAAQTLSSLRDSPLLNYDPSSPEERSPPSASPSTRMEGPSKTDVTLAELEGNAQNRGCLPEGK